VKDSVESESESKVRRTVDALLVAELLSSSIAHPREFPERFGPTPEAVQVRAERRSCVGYEKTGGQNPSPEACVPTAVGPSCQH
jgi:hypothetical protein